MSRKSICGLLIAVAGSASACVGSGGESTAERQMALEDKLAGVAGELDMSTAQVDPHTGAEIIRDAPCNMLIPRDGNVEHLSSTDSMVVFGPQDEDMLICHAEGVPSPPSSPAFAEGFECSVGGTVTLESRAALTPSGQLFLTCRRGPSTDAPTDAPE